MSNGRQTALQIRIGLFVLVGLGVFLAIIYLLGAQARYFERKYNLIAEFGQVGGLIEGATVRLAGVQVGRVTSVDLPPEPGGKVRVTLTIARRYVNRIRKDSVVQIVTQGLLGDKLVDISIGSPTAPPAEPGDHLVAQDPQETSQVLAEAGETLVKVRQFASTLNGVVERIDKTGAVDQISRLAATLDRTVSRLDKAGTIDDLSAAAKSARRVTEQVEKGGGMLHALVYEDPETLRRLNALLQSAQDLLARAQSGDNAVSVLLSPESGKSARSLMAALDALGRSAEKPGAGDGLLPALLFDPQYRSVADDLQTVARNFRDVSQKVANGEGLLGQVVQGGDDTPLGRATADFAAAMANLRAISERLNEGQGTMGALLQDPTLYEKLTQFLEGSHRSFLLRTLIRLAVGNSASGGK